MGFIIIYSGVFIIAPVLLTFIHTAPYPTKNIRFAPLVPTNRSRKIRRRKKMSEVAATTTISSTTDASSSSTTVPTSQQEQQQQTLLPMEKVRTMIDACATGDLSTIQRLVNEDSLFACQQDLETGISPLMAASKVGNLELVQTLLDLGAPWNAIDRQGQCAGNYAMQSEKWDVVNLLVDWATRAELILGELQRSNRGTQQQQQQQTNQNNLLVADQQSSTKPDYLQHQVRYNKDKTALLDEDDDAIMMEWERPIMKAHAQILMENSQSCHVGKRVMNIGFGMGIIDSILQEGGGGGPEQQGGKPSLHIIVEAHPDVYKKMLADKWDQKPNVRLCYGKWQDVLPKLVEEGVEVDAIFYDTYGEHAFDMEEFHLMMGKILSKPLGVYSFFNGLAPDNLFFHGVACQVIKLQLSKIGFDSEFLQCQIQVSNNNEVWDGIRRKYWHGRDVYYLPRVTWNQEYLGRKTKSLTTTAGDAGRTTMEDVQEQQNDHKRQRTTMMEE